MRGTVSRVRHMVPGGSQESFPKRKMRLATTRKFSDNNGVSRRLIPTPLQDKFLFARHTTEMQSETQRFRTGSQFNVYVLRGQDPLLASLLITPN
jgi:hypothetical protein